MPQLEQAGTFRGRIINYGLNEVQSGAISISITVAIDEAFDQKLQEWFSWKEHGMEVSGDLWVIKKDGTLNESQFRALMGPAGWDGSFLSIVDHSWDAHPVQVVVNEDTFKGSTRWRITWINDYSQRFGSSNVTTEKLKQIEAQYGAQVRAIGHNMVQNMAAVPQGVEGPKKVPVRQEEEKASGKSQANDSHGPLSPPPAARPVVPGDDIPF